ncbi:hypothetical protein CEXT_454241 [Caerostris extrusa]|uniref:Rab-GAP TBC domain-containing protein n=1 Tax=Caerostris extrusa TaxID=172846 RepID=A0AAV4SIT0_CAEEX|nr:hypothetical protein CEXT_454241 [Caerostris extrusa]
MDNLCRSLPLPSEELVDVLRILDLFAQLIFYYPTAFASTQYSAGIISVFTGVLVEDTFWQGYDVCALLSHQTIYFRVINYSYNKRLLDVSWRSFLSVNFCVKFKDSKQ